MIYHGFGSALGTATDLLLKIAKITIDQVLQQDNSFQLTCANLDRLQEYTNFAIPLALNPHVVISFFTSLTHVNFGLPLPVEDYPQCDAINLLTGAIIGLCCTQPILVSSLLLRGKFAASTIYK